MERFYFKELDDVYRRILGRPIDTSGLKTYSSLLRSGRYSLDDVSEILRSSKEFTMRELARERARQFRLQVDNEVCETPKTLPCYHTPKIPHSSLMANDSTYHFLGKQPLHKHPTPNSPLFQNNTNSPVIEFEPGKARFSTCSDCNWFHGNYLATVNVIGNVLHIYKFDPYSLTLNLVQELRTDMNWPEMAAVAPDESQIAIAHSGRGGYISIHGIDKFTHKFEPQGRRILVGAARPQLHGVRYTPDSRFLVFTGADDPGFIAVHDAKTLEHVQTIVNCQTPLKPKAIEFTPDGRFIFIVYSLNGGNERPTNGALGVYPFDPETGVFHNTPVSILHDEQCEFLANPEGITVLPDGRHLLVPNLGDCSVSLFRFDGGKIVPIRWLLKGPPLCDPHGVGLSKDGQFIAFANFGDDSVQIHSMQQLDTTIILLERDQDRTRHVNNVLIRQLVNQGVVLPQIVSALDGNNSEHVAEVLGRTSLGDPSIPGAASVFMQRKLCCALSHIRAWNQGRDGIPMLVLEDDAVLAPNLLRKVEELVEFSDVNYPSWHLIYLYSPIVLSSPCENPVVPYNQEFVSHHGNVGYLISLEGRQKLSTLIGRHINRLGTTELAKSQEVSHFALDHTIVQLARQNKAKVLWAIEPLVETVGQISRQAVKGDLVSNIYV